MAFGDLLEMVGGLGKFQAIHVVLLTFPDLFMSCHNLLQNFVAAVPDHRCRVQLGDEGSRYLNVTEEPLREEFLRVFLPLDEEGRPDKCRMYTSPQWHLLGTNETQGNGSQPDTQACTDGWVYDRSQFTSTIVTEWDLVCDRKSLKRMVQSIYMAGLLIGACVLGRLSDKFGRRTLLQWSYLLLAVSGTCAAFSSSFPLFCFWRFLSGVGLSGVIINSISLNIEWIPTRFRTPISMSGSFCYTLGQILLAGIAYGLKDWYWLQLSVSTPFFVFFLYSWWLSESARWLIVNGKEHVALKQLKRAAKVNGREAEGERLTVKILKASVENDQLTAKKQSVLDLFRTPVMRRITCCMMVVWFSTSFAYYGLSIDLQGFGVNIYLIQLIFGAVDFPAKTTAFLTLSLIGRRFTQVTTLTLAGSTILVNSMIPKDLQNVRTSLAALGKGCLSASFTCCYLYVTELYPTVVRQTGMGLVGTMARVGAMVAPIIRLTGDYIPFLPSLIYGGMTVVAGITAFFLLETRNIPLPETIEDVENRAMTSSKRASKLKNEDIPLREGHASLMEQKV
ncbi:solute carrier family 22 member 6-A-like isoform X1 [Hypanus sabinus]|uniref:solute carrier family 22 member 6-A-like isoform X1 n=1 Tax=Hypanus sabinus TaxID=79690 RepID=UPI0028C49877|nr:solute carrier family 22 member 6-A-like isoform X1 [Hypanus sabinus]